MVARGLRLNDWWHTFLKRATYFMTARDLVESLTLCETAIWRAGATGEEGAKQWSCWSVDKAAAEAYLDNPGFGGPALRSIELPDSGTILDAGVTNRVGMSDLAVALGFAREVGEKWFDNGWRYPWEESRQVREALATSGYDWLRYTDDYPEGAATLMALVDH